MNIFPCRLGDEPDAEQSCELSHDGVALPRDGGYLSFEYGLGVEAGKLFRLVRRDGKWARGPVAPQHPRSRAEPADWWTWDHLAAGCFLAELTYPAFYGPMPVRWYLDLRKTPRGVALYCISDSPDWLMDQYGDHDDARP